jgi:hypothetical protein
MADWRFLLFDAVTRKAQAEIPLINSVRFGETLNAPGSFSVTLPLLQSASSSVTPAMLAPPRAVMAFERDDVLVFAGFIWTHGYDISAGTLTLAGEGYQSVLRRRILRATKTYLAASGWQQEQIAWDLIAYAQGVTGGDLGIVDKHYVSGLLRDRTYFGYERKFVGQLIEQLAAVNGGFDFRFSPTWTAGPNTTLEVDFLTTYPCYGRNTGIVWELGSNCTMPSASLDGTNLAFSVDALGQGMGELMPIANATNAAAQGSFALDDQVTSGDITNLATLTDHAKHRLARGSQPVLIPTVMVGSDLLGTFIVGDQARCVANYGLLQLDGQYRITGYEVTIPGQGPESVSLTHAPLELFETM